MTRRYKTSYKSPRGLKRFHVVFNAPAQPQNEFERLKLQIQKERQFIERYQNYKQLCREADSRITYYEKRLNEAKMQADCDMMLEAGGAMLDGLRAAVEAVYDGDVQVVPSRIERDLLAAANAAGFPQAEIVRNVTENGVTEAPYIKDGVSNAAWFASVEEEPY